jgi:anti-anti-sigma factor
MPAGAPLLACTVDREDGIYVLNAVGEIDRSNLAEFEACLSAGFAEAQRIILDLRGIRFVDSAALEVLVTYNRLAGIRDYVFLIVWPRKLRRLLEIVRLREHLRLADTFEAALAAARSGASVPSNNST